MITRTLGFYPTNWIKQLDPSSSGTLRDDSGREYDVQLTVNLSPEQLDSILDYISANYENHYNLNLFNCTNFAINACGAGGLNLPATIGVWPGGGGLNPGKLGVDLMNMPLPSNYVSRSNGGGYADSNQGNCD